MSKNIVRDGGDVKCFTASLAAVPEGQLVSSKRSGSARLQASLTALKEQAYEDGRRAGFDAGFETGVKEGRMTGHSEAKTQFENLHGDELVAFRDALQEFAQRAEGAIEDWYGKAEEALTGLALEIASRAIVADLSINRESVVEIAREAISEVRHGTEVRIRLNPFDAGILDARKGEILAAVAGVRSIEIVPDLTVKSGCQIDTDGGVIDARIDTYLSRLAKEAA
ncbi:MAG: hypothetical protein JSS66_08295 [Armatimonadetes bacterium]|nr:hypothetical protein [Armatimonadota bacterium]